MSKRMASFPLMVFDLDGTLVDALPDLTAALNRMLAARGLQPLAQTDVRPMIGDAIAPRGTYEAVYEGHRAARKL